MKRKKIIIERAKEVWDEVLKDKKNEFILYFYPTFGDYWKECERINNLSDEEWYSFFKLSSPKSVYEKIANRIIPEFSETCKRGKCKHLKCECGHCQSYHINRIGECAQLNLDLTICKCRQFKEKGKKNKYGDFK